MTCFLCAEEKSEEDVHAVHGDDTRAHHPLHHHLAGHQIRQRGTGLLQMTSSVCDCVSGCSLVREVKTCVMLG